MQNGAGSLTQILRDMRVSRSITQMELSFRLGVSQRHISFVEIGRARPSRDLILSWARETGASPDERSAALVSAGLSPAIVEYGTAQVRDSPAFKALSGMLVAHDPCPGIIFDADWMIRAMNDGGQWLCTVGMSGFLADMDGPPSGMDMIAAITHPGGMLSLVRNAPEVGSALLRQLRAEQLTWPSLRPRVDRFEASLKERFDLPAVDQQRAAGEPHLTLIVDSPFGTLSFLLVQTVFGLPHNVTHASLRTELWFPTDERTRRVMETRGGGAAPGPVQAMPQRVNQP